MLPTRATNIAFSCAALLALTASCGGRSVSTVAPSEPEVAVRMFLNAVREGSLRGMGELWGDERGPAARRMSDQELEQRLTIIRSYLQHDRFELVGDNAGLGVSGRTRTVSVRLFRRGCEPVVPFTVLRYREGWLVTNIDLGAAGNPQRTCVRR